MSRNITYNIVANDKFSAVSDQVTNKVSRLAGRMNSFNADVKKLGITWDDVAGKLNNLASKMKWVSAGVVAAGTYALKAASSHEALGISFEMLGMSAQDAKKYVDQLYDIALDLPVVDENQIISGAKTLLNMGQSAEQAAKRMKMLASISVAAEIPLDSLVQTIGRMERQGFVSSRSFMALNKIGLDKMLAEKYGDTVQNVLTAASKKLIPASVAIELLEKRANGYADSLSRMDKTTNEQFGDTLLLLTLNVAAFGEALGSLFGVAGGLDQINVKLREFKTGADAFYKAHPGIVRLIGYVGLLVVALTPLLIIAAGVSTAIGFISSVAAGASVTFSVAAAVVGALGFGVTALIVAIGIVIYKWEFFKDLFFKSWDYILQKIEAVKSAARGMFDFGGKLLGYTMGIDATSRSQANVDINLNAPRGTVKSARATSISPDLNIGLAMATSG